jgi:hypothetical protein
MLENLIPIDRKPKVFLKTHFTAGIFFTVLTNLNSDLKKSNRKSFKF